MDDNRLRVGIVGCGGITRALYVRVYALVADIARVVAVADLDEGRANHVRTVLGDAYNSEAYRSRVLAADARKPEERDAYLRKAELAASAATHKIRRYRDHEELLKDNEVDVMVLLTPPPVRAEPTIAAAEAGRHIFTEGPMARSVEEADAMAAAIRKAGVKYDCQLIDRFPRDMVLARKAVESGKLGQIGFANVELNLYQPQSYYSPTRANNWHGTWQGEGGGAVFHHGRYIIDPFLWVVGSRVVEVFAYSGPMLRVIEHDSLTQVVLRFANGATGMIHVSLISQSALEVRQNVSVGLRGRISIAGQDAHLVTQNENLRQGPDGLPPIQSRTSFVSRDAQDALEALRAEVEDLPATITQEQQTRGFLECVINDTEPLVPLEVPHHHVEVVRAIYKSSEENQPVALPLDKDDPWYSFKGRFAAGRKPSS